MKRVPANIDQAASDRVAKTAVTQQKEVHKAIIEGRPLDAEVDTERKLAFIQKTVNVDRDLAVSIANYEDPEHLSLSPIQKAQAESLQGSTNDFVPIRFLDIARAASRSVARVAFQNRTAQGTGFLVSPHLFLTNYHVISSIEDAKSFVIEFDYEEDGDLNKVPITRFALDPSRFFLVDPDDDLDFALVAVGSRIDGKHQLSDFGYLPLIGTQDKHIMALYTNVIQHPEGRPKEIVLRENRILARTKNTLIYGADTLKGSSGSPVFNDSWEVIALHHWSAPHRALLDEDGKTLPQNGNEGIRISSIMEHLRTEIAQLPEAKVNLLEEALKTTSRFPSLFSSKSAEKNASVPMRSTTHQVSNQNPQVSQDGTATWTIPLTISMRLGLPENPMHPSLLADAAESSDIPSSGIVRKKFIPDPDYSTRKGYNPRFLGKRVDLPKLSAAQKKIASKNLAATENEDPFEIKYHNFSLMVNAKRRLPFFTAVNIDGAAVIKFKRETGEVTSVEGIAVEAEATEKWYVDPRIDPIHQSDQKLYDASELKGFHRGHLVKRTDPSWGASTEMAFLAQADTFHFTNCSPQHEGFNPNKTRWAGVEDWITKDSDDKNILVTVFSGPILEKDDPPRNYILVPLKFWKIIVRVDKNKLLATAILADQSDLVPKVGPEDLSPLPSKIPVEYQCTIREIEKLTKLDFGLLRDHDTFKKGPESIAERQQIYNYQDIQF